MDHKKGVCMWTNESHMNYLSSMEDSFVRSMILHINECDRPTLPLNRQLPDSFESTLDLKKNKIRRNSTSDIPNQRNRTDKKTRRKSYEKSNASQDQVVPQLEIGTKI